ncbi:MAG: CapA family protein [Turicibacter sp.]|nr:CapA family protein [Turicibacter sp.]
MGKKIVKSGIVALILGFGFGIAMMIGIGITGLLVELSAPASHIAVQMQLQAETIIFETADDEIAETPEISDTFFETNDLSDIFDTEEDYEEFLEEFSNVTTITISAAGDVTLGGDERWHGYHRFMAEFERNGHAFFFENVRDIFYNSDLAIVNLEGTLTYAEEGADKPFIFRGPPHFAQILSAGAVNVVSLANNHTFDYFEAGYIDTINALRAEEIAFFGNEHNTIIEVQGINVGLFGFRVWDTSQGNRNRITAAINDLKDRGADLIIAYHHWGAEHENIANTVQREMARHTVNAGANLVLGSHPHVIQGLEVYNNVNIVYSLANFSFGGNSNPSDQDTFIFQQTFTFIDGELLQDNETVIIPAFISSVRNTNNFQPTPATGADAERILERLRKYSKAEPQ